MKTHARPPTRHLAVALAAGAALTVAEPATAAFFDMPIGGTHWIEVSSNGCDLGVPANGGDCFGASTLLPPAQYLLEPGGQLFASGSVTADRIVLSQRAVRQPFAGAAGGFVWAATGGLFTLHGTGTQPVTVTATMTVDASIDKLPLTVGSVSYKIGTWQFGGEASEVNRHVAGNGGRSRGCGLNECPGGLQVDDVLELQLDVVPGQTFNLGFQLVTSTLALDPAGVSIASIADLAVSAGPGFFITGTNGYDSRVSAVPEPGAWALLLAGIAVVSLRARATRA